MKGNKITEWEYETPTEPGFYMYCYGDVETTENAGLAELTGFANDGSPIDIDGWIFDRNLTAYKWARLLMGSDAK